MEPSSFSWDSNAPEHLYCETLDPLEKTLAFSSTSLYERRKGVAQWNFLLGCVRLGHRYMENTLISQVATIMPPFTPNRQFSPITPHT